MNDYIIAIDQGTTSSRAIVFDTDFRNLATGQQEFQQHFPDSGWVEHEPEDIWDTTVLTARSAMDKAGAAARDIAAIGITNQRETTLIWDRDTGKPIHRAIVWQDRRTVPMCERLKAHGLEPIFSEKTGLLLDPYFSGTKIAWLLNKVPAARARAEAGKLAFGTVDSFLLWRLTGGKAHVTDASNASRTLLWNLQQRDWDPWLCELFDVPVDLLPECRPVCSNHNRMVNSGIPITAVNGDQTAALYAHGQPEGDTILVNIGTGAFVLLPTGKDDAVSETQL